MTGSGDMRTLYVAGGQILCQVGDVEHNLRQIEEMAAEAAGRGARLILFGEGAMTGYLLSEEVLAVAPTADGPEAQRLVAAARQHDIVIVAGTLERCREGHHVSAFIAFPDGRLLVQRKHNLTPQETEARIIPGSRERLFFEVDGVRCAVCICADSGIDGIHNYLALNGCQVYLGPTAGGGGRQHMVHEADIEDPEKRRKYVEDMEKVCFLGPAIEQCAAHHMALIAVNLAGDDGVSNYHPGHSSIVDSRGRSVALFPGEYVVEWLRPQLIHGEIVVQQPRTVEETPQAENV